MACEVSGLPPAEVLALPELERQLLVESAVELESWRLDQFAKIMGAK